MIRRLSRVADSSSQQQQQQGRGVVVGTGGKEERRGGHVRAPEGHVPVYVGEEMERFVVRAELLSRPVFVAMLRRSAQEYGYEQRGVLRIPCPAPLFRRALDAILAADDHRPAAAEAEAEAELLRYLDDG
ncbi:Auxin-responsive protein SAUR71 [Ananas comosus]|uniref:Auxin-responsive protein SAUR71 n=1 Tax=Ananas comosus TaxID=4615 RepID=A0A199VVI6_ANACO|nr:Auxin-responsive protein SAUR71 [Ananas comosus]